MIPRTFDQWKDCIENQCGIPLTPSFVQGRLAVYAKADHPETKKFVSLYGEQHLENVKRWLRQAA